MEYRQLGKSGLRVSQLCLGTMVGFSQKNQNEATRIIHEAIDSGINFIDTADCYGDSEETVGNALAEGNKREKVVLATKFGWYMGEGPNDYGTGRKHLIKQCEESLRKLKTDYIDLYIVHVVDPNTPLEELLYTLDVLVRSGKIRYIGTSKHPSFMILEGLNISTKYGWARFINEQTPYNLLDRRAENELLPMCIKYGVGVTTFFPLAEGLLSGKYRLTKAQQPVGRITRGYTLDKGEIFTTKALETIEKLIPIAENKGISLAELSLAWLMHQPGVVSAIVGARTVEYLESAIRACEVSFEKEELEKIDQIVPPGGFVSNYYEANVYRPLRMKYSAEAKKIPETGAFIPKNNTGCST